MKLSTFALITIVIFASAQGGNAPPYCKSDECREVEAIKASNLCGTGPGAAAAWIDDPFEPDRVVVEHIVNLTPELHVHSAR